LSYASPTVPIAGRTPIVLQRSRVLPSFSLVAAMENAFGATLLERHVSAASMSSALVCSPIDQPTTRLLHTSSTTAKKMKPAQVGT
jgi:hypothetical protein